MKKLLFAALLFTTSFTFAQHIKLSETVNGKDYSIKYAKNWSVDNSGRNGPTLILFSAIEGSGDDFSENINLLIQDLSGRNINIDQYTEISEDQIRANGKLIESKRIKRNNIDVQQVKYEATLNNRALKFRQYYFIKNEKAYVLTFTAESKNFDKYIVEAEAIMETFKIR